MFRVYSCLAHQHNLALVLVAALICLSACFVAVRRYVARHPHLEHAFRPAAPVLAEA